MLIISFKCHLEIQFSVNRQLLHQNYIVSKAGLTHGANDVKSKYTTSDKVEH